jgi:hypothetical protein
LKGYDYSREGLYFVTICCYDRFCYFGHIDNDAMILNQYGQIVFDEWMKLPERYRRGNTCVAPDVNSVALIGDAVPHDTIGAGVNPAPMGTGVSDIVGVYKSLVTNNHTNALLYIL